MDHILGSITISHGSNDGLSDGGVRMYKNPHYIKTLECLSLQWELPPSLGIFSESRGWGARGALELNHLQFERSSCWLETCLSDSQFLNNPTPPDITILNFRVWCKLRRCFQVAEEVGPGSWIIRSKGNWLILPYKLEEKIFKMPSWWGGINVQETVL